MIFVPMDIGLTCNLPESSESKPKVKWQAKRLITCLRNHQPPTVFWPNGCQIGFCPKNDYDIRNQHPKVHEIDNFYKNRRCVTNNVICPNPRKKCLAVTKCTEKYLQFAQVKVQSGVFYNKQIESKNQHFVTKYVLIRMQADHVVWLDYNRYDNTCYW
jgi:hypothetical protein